MPSNNPNSVVDNKYDLSSLEKQYNESKQLYIENTQNVEVLHQIRQSFFEVSEKYCEALIANGDDDKAKRIINEVITTCPPDFKLDIELEFKKLKEKVLLKLTNTKHTQSVVISHIKLPTKLTRFDTNLLYDPDPEIGSETNSTLDIKHVPITSISKKSSASVERAALIAAALQVALCDLESDEPLTLQRADGSPLASDQKVYREVYVHASHVNARAVDPSRAKEPPVTNNNLVADNNAENKIALPDLKIAYETLKTVFQSDKSHRESFLTAAANYADALGVKDRKEYNRVINDIIEFQVREPQPTPNSVVTFHGPVIKGYFDVKKTNASELELTSSVYDAPPSSPRTPSPGPG